jgi:hypothetical protein
MTPEKTDSEIVSQSIRENFSGPNNAGLRKLLRETYASNGTVRGIAGRVALTYQGRASLDAVERTIRELDAARME